MMPTIREILDAPENHPGAYRALIGDMDFGGPGSGRRPSGSTTKRVGFPINRTRTRSTKRTKRGGGTWVRKGMGWY